MAELHAHNMYPNENFTTKSNPRIKYPYAERNKDSILTTMTPYLLQCKRVLELASGSGQHISYIAEKFPEIQFQPSEIPDEKLHASIKSYIAELSNVKKPIALDALNETDWEKLTGENVDLVYFVNLLHISSWRVTEMVSKNVSELLESGGWCIVYGPFKKDGKFTTESNEEFDTSLKLRNSEWGLRDIADVAKEFGKHGISLQEIVDMPANNFILVFRKD